MKVVKVSQPDWEHLRVGRPSLKDMLPNNGVWGDFMFEINNPECTECDFWIIYESTSEKETINCPKENVFLITTEEVDQRQYNSKYISQFPKVITSRQDLNGKDVIKTHYMNAWFFNENYENLKALELPVKKKNISLICSDLVRIEGHKKRYAFTNKLIGHFKDRIDVFGRGSNFVKEKQDALLDYKYSIAIENASISNYWTEKITDCYLSYTIPIYYGCPNIEDFFESKSMCRINIDDWRGAIEVIEELLSQDPYEKRIDYIKRARNLILEEYQLFANISHLLKKHESKNLNPPRSKITIRSHNSFKEMTNAKIAVKAGISNAMKYFKLTLKNA